MIKVGVVGATGYTGIELLRILLLHPQVELTVLTSRSEQGKPVSDLFPALREHTQIKFVVPDIDQLAACDVVFFATPHAVSMHTVPALIEKGVKVIDLSADFRLQDIALWEQWYGEKHVAPELVKQAVYGSPEINREQIKNAQLIACPGCYPTSVQLGLMPLVKQELISLEDIIANVASGVSGAGKKASVALLHTEVSDSFKAYAAQGHRHAPEIRQNLGLLAGQEIDLTFVPHLLPMNRGILASIYAKLESNLSVDELQSVFEKAYKDEPFVDVMPQGSHPATRSVKGSNMCRIAVHVPEGGNKVLVLSAIDNLVKGSSGQAVQCMNLMFGYAENLGLNAVSLIP